MWASLTAAAESAASSLKEAGEAAQRLKQKIEEDLSAEYEATALGNSGADAALPVLTHEAPPEPSTLERAKKVGAALFNPLEDAGGTTAGDNVVPDRVIMLPWEQPGLPDSVRSRMRALSQERSIFLAPPTGGHASFRFDLEASLPLVLEALRVDKRLEEQRHLLVPSQVAEEIFFTNYFHHLHVIANGGSGSCGGGRTLGAGASSEACGGGGTLGDARSGTRSPSSSSPVVVSEAVSEASDIPAGADDPATADAAAACTASPLCGGSAPLSRVTLEHGLRTPGGASTAMSIEEQFECVSAMLTPTALACATAPRPAAATVASTSAPVAAGATPSATIAAATPSSRPVDRSVESVGGTAAGAKAPPAALPSVPLQGADATPCPPPPLVGAGAPHSGAATTPAAALTLSWEEEMRAELG